MYLGRVAAAELGVGSVGERVDGGYDCTECGGNHDEESMDGGMGAQRVAHSFMCVHHLTVWLRTLFITRVWCTQGIIVRQYTHQLCVQPRALPCSDRGYL